MKKMMILAVMMVMTISARSAMPLGSSKNAMSYNAAKHEALFLSDKMAYEHKATVLTPDLPLHPADAIRLIREICEREKPAILVGNSCGSFYAQMISPIIGVPALLDNPHFKMSDFLRERIGSHQYKSPRADGNQDFTITKEHRMTA